MAIGDIITAARYNNLQSRVATILGTGSGDDGYGQTLNSNQVASTATINATDMSTLYTDIANGRVHQTGTAPSEIAIITQGSTILDSDTVNKKGVAQFENLTTTLENEKFQIHSSQATAEAAKTAQYSSAVVLPLLRMLSDGIVGVVIISLLAWNNGPALLLMIFLFGSFVIIQNKRPLRFA